MSELARFDTGHDLQWLPAGLYSVGLNIAAGPSLVCGFASTDGRLYVRVDWASVNLDFSVLDLQATAQLIYGTGAISTWIPFLSVSAHVMTTVADAPIIDPAVSAQLTQPIYSAAVGGIGIRGAGAALGDSTMSATVSLSMAYGIPT
jgi:hypothetical protein